MKYFIRFLLFACLSALILSSCKTSISCPEKYKKQKIYFGNGGGFTGKLNEFCLLENGDVFAINPESRDATLRSNMGKKEAKSIFEDLHGLELNKYAYDQPGNMYYWLKYETEADTSYLIWGDEGMTVDTKITKLFEQLVALTKQQNLQQQ